MSATDHGRLATPPGSRASTEPQDASPPSASVPIAALSMEEFCERFSAEMLRLAGREAFDDGTPIADYARRAGPTYFDSQHQESGESPEDCAEADVSYWGDL